MVKKDRDNKKYFVNEDIRGDKILVLTEDGEKIGVMRKSEALQEAEKREVDLVQVGYNPKDNIVIAKLIDFGKYLYQLKKQEKEKKKNQKTKGMKEIKFGYNIGEKDFEVKLNKAKQLLQEGYSVKFLAELRGREYIYKDKMIERLNLIKEKLSDVSKPNDIKQEKRGYSMILFSKVK